MISDLQKFLLEKPEISLTNEQIKNINAARRVVLDVIEKNKTVYGINTGFGKLSHIKIDKKDLQKLQENLLRSHACGVDKPVDTEIVSLVMYLKVKNLSNGNSGCSIEVVNKIIELLNKEIFPKIPRRGSVGASGDLAPLAHMSLPLIGEGEVFYQGKFVNASELVRDGVYQPVELGPKDGLSLINGTQYSTALLCHGILKARKILSLAEVAVSMSIEADMATDVPFREEIHKVRKQVGQQRVAKNIRNLLKFSEITKSHKNCEKVQDPYCYRCTPQVLGMVRDTLDFVEQIAEREIDAVTDNPLVFPEENNIFSGGNFHAEPIAMAADYLSIALTECGNISERRIANLTDTTMSGLPPFLVESSGINSGFMIAHVTAAALTAENRTMANPASVETVSTSANQEDHVSMAPNAGLKLLRIINNLKKIIWIEMMAAAQGIDFRRPLKSGIGVQLGYEKVRESVKFLDQDRIMYHDIEQSEKILSDNKFFENLKKIMNNK